MSTNRTDAAASEGLPRVLFVDDEPHVLAAIQDSLRRRFQVVTAGSGVEGLDVLRSSPAFAVIVSDFRMPEMNGAEFLASARRLAPHIPRVMLTGQATVENAIAAVNEGNIYKLLTKPCSPPDLIDSLDAAVEYGRTLVALPPVLPIGDDSRLRSSGPDGRSALGSITAAMRQLVNAIGDRPASDASDQSWRADVEAAVARGLPWRVISARCSAAGSLYSAELVHTENGECRCVVVSPRAFPNSAVRIAEVVRQLHRDR
jgi:CheY-like chemotaxis protein